MLRRTNGNRCGTPGARAAARLALAGSVALSLSGCLTFSRGIQDLRLPRYRPDLDRRGEWYEELHAPAPEPGTPEKAAAVPAPVSVEPSMPATEPAGRTPAPAPIPPAEPAPGVVTAAVSRAGSLPASVQLRTIMSGDRLTIMVDGPEPQKFEDVVDDRGSIRLPHIGAVQAAGKPTSEVEDAIEQAYIKGLIYRYVNVTVVSLDDEFFIRGEVKREGRFALTGAMTLGKAITVASGFTEYANRKKVEIQRGNEIISFDMERIYSGKDEDPLLRRGDQVYVPRRFM
jgi:polysaccharide export outer membrane protein